MELGFFHIDMSGIRDVIFIQDMNLNLTFVSPSVTSVFGYTVEEALQLKMDQFLTPESFKKGLESFQEMTRLVQKEGEVDVPLMEYQYIRKDGSTFWGELKVTYLRDSEGRLIGVQGILRDIDERKKAEYDLCQSKLKFRTLFDLSPQAIAVTQAKTGCLIDVNEKFCELTKYKKEEVIGKGTTELGFYSEEDRKKFVNELRHSGEVQGLKMDFKAKDGSILNAEMFAKLIQIYNEQHVITVFYDRTHERKLENQFFQAQKMEAVGNLAGGIAHDFNNLLMGITGNISLMLMHMDKSHPHYEMLLAIEKHALSCSRLTQQLLGYARKGKNEITSLDLNEIINTTADSFQRTRKQITVCKDLSTVLMPVEADRGQMEQVLYNLYVNAADAMPKGGRLTITTSNVSDQDMTVRSYKPEKKQYVSISIRDTGLGMDAYTREHIFEPFFTTKEKGKGTGLGMASVYGIVKGHNGYIDVASDVGEGTEFIIYLPASSREGETPELNLPNVIRTTGTVLFVDDEEDNLMVGSLMLEKIGFRVLKAESGERAIEIYQRHGKEIDLILLDVIMPGMDAGELYERMMKICSDVIVLLCSGYSLEGGAQEMLQCGCDGFIQKPFNIESLSQKISEVLKTDTLKQ